MFEYASYVKLSRVKVKLDVTILGHVSDLLFMQYEATSNNWMNLIPATITG